MLKEAELKDKAFEIISKMVDKEMLAVDEVLPKLAEFQSKGLDELNIVEKALELGTSVDITKLGELSDRKELSGMTAEERFIHNTIGDLI